MGTEITEAELVHQIGARVRAIRRSRGLTRNDLAEVLGKSPVTISGIENAHQTMRLLDLRELCIKLRIDANYMLGIIASPNQIVK